MQQRKRLVLLKSECLIFFYAIAFGISILFLSLQAFLSLALSLYFIDALFYVSFYRQTI